MVANFLFLTRRIVIISVGDAFGINGLWREVIAGFAQLASCG